MTRIIILFIALLFHLTGWSQIEKKDVLGAYIYNFAKLSTAPQQTELPFYHIVVISDDKAIISEFKRMEKEATIRNKPIKLTVDPYAVNDYNSACLIFVSAEKANLYPEVYRKTKKNQTLLVTENFADKTMIMLNLFESENKIKFEMNKGNIYSRGIEIDDEILLMGGNIIDLAEMYVNSQQQLKTVDSKLNIVQDSLGALSHELDNNQREISNQQEKLQSQKNIIEKQKNERHLLTNEITDYKSQIKNHEQAYIQIEQKLIQFNDSLQLSKNMLSRYKDEISNNKKILQEQQKQIKANEQILYQKNDTIKTQQNIVIFSIVGITVTLILFTLLLISYRDKKKKNALLKKQKSEIEEQYDILKKNKNLIESMMDELGDKNEELETTLEENKRIQNKLVQSEKMASLGVLSAGIAHEINNPINFVYAGINSLLRDFEDIEPVINEVSKIDIEKDNLREKIEYIQKLKEENYFDDAMEAIPDIIGDIKLGADRTAEIVKGLRNFTRMDKDTYENLDINNGLDTSLLLLKNKYKDRIEIIKNYDPELPQLLCYPGKINQAFLNILSNAVDAIKEKGTIWIATKATEESIDISIKDSGIGIPRDMQTRIFDPFFTTKAVGEGTGLGLSITFGIIEEHFGTIDVSSAPDTGSEFIIRLPLN
ncbi:YfiR/HmsC family protein [Plebeiibacterium sediminum]|uniref:histidine kinase n=1 Tax=Plebeiibacterium sediminum TaxID=2992112 RepID=A0AAE3M2N3_9BACT|nr:YfiR/HmsC family protein [Plebeiobacterium sediminum]MCW3785635.1 YfiR/HmsC family protein [Plebeiobacterium sediminum]